MNNLGVIESHKEEDIEQLRTKMVDAASTYGMEHPLVLYYSRQIDRKHTALLKK
ncbi:aspartyl-phosphate phosphatase Spo0E family protein [Natribacillus halophilus]|uniref:Spo0E like sporulation regulatory protein n=1 Tax=Natribacillus halophilus TaxID=549003 RepID=A0A1G8RPM1_9BACI|nr:aspartyl-phosphate phosphatase Spo0E family protein [Natribacillus halophilus]SDJ18896.1 Spo0E like sporulation regulatory protein [Natribacillus halophilus]